MSAGSGSLLAECAVSHGRESAVPRPAVAALLPAVAALALLTPRVEIRHADQPGTGTEDAVRFRYRWQHWGERGEEWRAAMEWSWQKTRSAGRCILNAGREFRLCQAHREAGTAAASL